MRLTNSIINFRPRQGVLVPYALMDTLMREHGVCYEQGMASTEVQ